MIRIITTTVPTIAFAGVSFLLGAGTVAAVYAAENPAARTPVAAAAASAPPATAADAAPPKLEPEIRRALGRMLDTSSAGLVERTHGGVTSVELGRRFHMAPVATVDAKGDVHIREYSDLPEEPAQANPP